MKTVFTSERLIFREFTVEDSTLIYQLNSDPQVTKYVHEPPTTEESSVEIIEKIILPQYKKHNYGRWAVHLKGTNEFIGWCGLKYVRERNHTDLGFRLMKKYWGQGYATEAAKKCINYGFTTIGLERIFAAAHVDNVASWKCLEKCGMQFIGFDVIDDCPVTTYEITRESWST